MLQLALLSNSSSAGRAEMYADYQDGSISFTVTHGEFQYDFNMEEHDWEVFVKFIELQKEAEKKLKNQNERSKK